MSNTPQEGGKQAQVPAQPGFWKSLMQSTALRLVEGGIVLGAVVGAGHYVRKHPEIMRDTVGAQFGTFITQVQETPQIRQLTADMERKKAECRRAIAAATEINQQCQRLAPSIETASPTQVAKASLCMQRAQFAAIMANTACGL